jgi:hypothetical protein
MQCDTFHSFLSTFLHSAALECHQHKRCATMLYWCPVFLYLRSVSVHLHYSMCGIVP